MSARRGGRKIVLVERKHTGGARGKKGPGMKVEKE